jgi:cytochrome b involved in lipid metabolism
MIKAMVKKITKDELAKHNTEQDCWVSVSGGVYDVTNFIPKHLFVWLKCSHC